MKNLLSLLNFSLFKGKRERERALTCWFPPQTPVKAGPGQELGTQSGAPVWVAGTPLLLSPSAASPGAHQQEAGVGAEVGHRHSGTGCGHHQGHLNHCGRCLPPGPHFESCWPGEFFIPSMLQFPNRRGAVGGLPPRRFEFLGDVLRPLKGQSVAGVLGWCWKRPRMGVYCRRGETPWRSGWPPLSGWAGRSQTGPSRCPAWAGLPSQPTGDRNLTRSHKKGGYTSPS